MSMMTPGERAQKLHQDRLELANLRRANRGPVLRPVLLGMTVIVLIVGSFVGYQMLRQNHGRNGGLVKEQTVTLTSGTDYALTSSGDLRPVSGTAGYFLRVTASGLSFPAGVHADTAPTWGTEYDDPCMDLGLPTYGDAAAFPWKEFKPGTRLCAEPQGRAGADVHDYLMTVKGLTSGQQLQVDITAWDEKNAVLNN